MVKPKIALVSIATGAPYHSYIRPWVASAREFFPACEILLFTDSREYFGVNQAHLPALGRVGATLMRYRAVLSQWEWLSKFDYIFQSDIDMRFVSPIATEEILSDGITAVLHPGYVGLKGTPETRSESMARVAEVKHYFCGGFVGGRTRDFLKMAATIQCGVDEDNKKGITAVWWDESHLNCYLEANPPAKILSPAFCYPEDRQEYYRGVWGRNYEPKILALTKDK